MKYAILLLFFSLFYNTTENIKTETYPPFVLFQLFTSQGCSSCPTADHLLEELKKETKNSNVIVMSYHVDYWNKLGWKDPFSKRAYTELQYKYARKFNSSSVYTPQLVVNGNNHFTGSNKNKIKHSLKQYTSKNALNTILLSKISKEERIINIDYEINGELTNKTISFALVLEEKTTFVKRGENTNRKIKNSNIVINQISILTHNKNKGTTSIRVPEQFNTNDNYRIIAFIQDSNLQVTGATQKTL